MTEFVLSRRKLIGGLGLLIAAPAIVRASSLMPVKAEPLVAHRWVVNFDVALDGSDQTAIYISSGGKIYEYKYIPQRIEWQEISIPISVRNAA